MGSPHLRKPSTLNQMSQHPRGRSIFWCKTGFFGGSMPTYPPRKCRLPAGFRGLGCRGLGFGFQLEARFWVPSPLYSTTLIWVCDKRPWSQRPTVWSSMLREGTHVNKRRMPSASRAQRTLIVQGHQMLNVSSIKAHPTPKP